MSFQVIILYSNSLLFPHINIEFMTIYMLLSSCFDVTNILYANTMNCYANVISLRRLNGEHIHTIYTQNYSTKKKRKKKESMKLAL